jgi:predicted RNA binding protein YcfA (HicA-like mRNA interferase family)
MKLPRITGREVVRALERAGFVFDRQRGSHVVLIHPQNRRRVTVPVHAGRSSNQARSRASWTMLVSLWKN